MLLTTEQKEIFMKWLELQITSAQGIKEQIKKLNMPSTVADSLIQREHATEVGCKIVLNILKSSESQVIK